jgi:hypothetical protein
MLYRIEYEINNSFTHEINLFVLKPQIIFIFVRNNYVPIVFEYNVQINSFNKSKTLFEKKSFIKMMFDYWLTKIKVEQR